MTGEIQYNHSVFLTRIMEIQNQKILSNGPEILLDYVNQCTNSVRLLHEVFS